MLRFLPCMFGPRIVRLPFETTPGAGTLCPPAAFNPLWRNPKSPEAASILGNIIPRRQVVVRPPPTVDLFSVFRLRHSLLLSSGGLSRATQRSWFAFFAKTAARQNEGVWIRWSRLEGAHWSLSSTSGVNWPREARVRCSFEPCSGYKSQGIKSLIYQPVVFFSVMLRSGPSSAISAFRSPSACSPFMKSRS